MANELKLKKSEEQFENCFSREIPLRVPSIDEDNRVIKGVMATETPAIVFDWMRFEPIREVLLVDGGIIPRKVPFLDSHSRFTSDDVIGSTFPKEIERDFETLGDVIPADNQFSSTEEKKFIKAKEGHLDSTSIGYRVYPDDTVEVGRGKEVEINGKVFKNNFSDGLRFVVRKKWELFENSLVPIGADKAAKFRSMLTGNIPVKSDGDENLLKEIKDLRKEQSELKIIINKGDRSVTEEEKRAAEERAAQENTARAEEKRVNGIKALTDKFRDKVKGLDLDSLKEIYVTGERSVKDFSDAIFENVQKNAPVNKPDADLTPKQKKEYSIARAMRSLVTNENCFEKEVSQDLEKRFGKAQGILVPHSVLDLKRDLTAGTATSGAELVATDHLAGEFIELLRNKMVFSQAGVRMLTGLQGNVEIPKWSSASTFGWASTENAQTSESTPGTTEVTMSPKRGGAYVEVSKTLLVQGTPSADALVTDDLTKVIALAIDAAIAHGTGSSGQPTGIISTSGIGSVTGASFDWQAALDFQSDVETANADANTMYYISRPAHRATLKARAKESGFPSYICEMDNNMAGYPYLATNQVNSGYVLFGDFSQVVLGMWGALDLVIDPYTKADYGLVRYIAQQLIDVAVRQPGALSACSDFS